MGHGPFDIGQSSFTTINFGDQQAVVFLGRESCTIESRRRRRQSWKKSLCELSEEGELQIDAAQRVRLWLSYMRFWVGGCLLVGGVG